jgi:Uma2 family endonuclease
MVQIARYSFTVDEYNRMGAAGIFPDGVRTELIEGEIVEMAPIGSYHSTVVARLARFFARALTDEQAITISQSPLELSTRSELEPDVLVLAPRSDEYVEHHPYPQEVRLLIEVSDTSIRLDRDIKLPLYAREGVQEVWIVDLTAEVIHVYREPAQGSYSFVRLASRSESLSPAAFPDLTLAVNDVLRR